MGKDIKFYDMSAAHALKDEILKNKEKFLMSEISISYISILGVSEAIIDNDYWLNYLKDLKKSNVSILSFPIEVLEDAFDEIPNNFLDIYANIDLTDEELICLLAELQYAYYANNHLYKDEIIYVTANEKIKDYANLLFGDGMIEYINK